MYKQKEFYDKWMELKEELDNNLDPKATTLFSTIKIIIFLIIYCQFISKKMTYRSFVNSLNKFKKILI